MLLLLDSRCVGVTHWDHQDDTPCHPGSRASLLGKWLSLVAVRLQDIPKPGVRKVFSLVDQVTFRIARDPAAPDSDDTVAQCRLPCGIPFGYGTEHWDILRTHSDLLCMLFFFCVTGSH